MNLNVLPASRTQLMSGCLTLPRNQLQDIKAGLFNSVVSVVVKEVTAPQLSWLSGAYVCGMTDRRLCHRFICTIMKWGQESAAVFALPSNCACVLMDSGLHYFVTLHLAEASITKIHSGEAGEHKNVTTSSSPIFITRQLHNTNMWEWI